jgi:hypothetical protein
MRKLKFFLLTSLCLFVSNGAKAIILTNGETVQVYGPDQPAIVDAQLIVALYFSPSDYSYPQDQAFYQASANLIGDFGAYPLSTCGSNVPGPCQPTQSIVEVQIEVLPTAPTITVTTSFMALAVNSSYNAAYPYLPYPAGSVSVDLEFETAGFSFGAPAPNRQPGRC